MNKIFNKDNYYLLLVFFLIYAGSNTVFSQVVISTQRAIILTAAVLLFLSFAQYRYRLRKNTVKILAVLEALILISVLVNSDADGFRGCMIIAVKILNGFLLFSCFDKRRVLTAYCRVMFLIGAASLVITFVFPLVNLQKYFPVMVNSVGVRFYNCILSVKIDSYGVFALRNYGIFSEPAVYCYYLFLAVMILFCDDQGGGKRYFRILVLCAVMITTFSPVGVLCAFSMLLILLYNTQRLKSVPTKKKLQVNLLLLVVLAIFLLNGEIRKHIITAMDKLYLSGGSGEGRIRAIWLSFVYAMRRPFFGGSLKAANVIVTTLGFNTSTTGTMLVSFGVFFAGLVTYMQFRSVKTIAQGKGAFLTVLFFLLYLVTINDYGLIQGDWYWYFAFIGICGGSLYEPSSDDLQPAGAGP